MHPRSRVTHNTLVPDGSDASFELRAIYLWMEHTSIISFITSCIDMRMEEIHLNGKMENIQM